jgi:hypothetical protein
MTEEEIHKAVIQNLIVRGLPGVFWFHPANGGKRSIREAKTFKAIGVVAGVPDLILIKDGKAYGLELKAEKGRLSPAQRITQEAMHDAGAMISVSHGLDEALYALEFWGLISRNVNVASASSETASQQGQPCRGTILKAS